MTGSDHSGRLYQAGYALRHPRRALRYAGCWGRDALRGLTSLDHLSYYRAAMRSGAVRNPELAVGSSSREDWLRHGQLQFDYLLGHGLRPSDRMLEIGCGNLRAGRLFIDYLDPGNYYGLDISPEILLDGQRTVAEFGLQAKLPHLALVSDLTFGFLPAAHFSIVHAHSVFSHSPRDVIGECLCNVGRIMAPGAFFDFTFHRTDDAEHHLLGWAFYYRSDTLLGLARSHGLDARIMTDWKRLGGPQSKIRVTAPSRDQALDNTETGAVSRGGGAAISRLLRSPVHHPHRRHVTTACYTEGNGRRTRIRAPQPCRRYPVALGGRLRRRLILGLHRSRPAERSRILKGIGASLQRATHGTR